MIPWFSKFAFSNSTCTATPRTAQASRPRAFGIKNGVFLSHLPTLRAAAHELGLAKLTYVHVVRDGRDHLSGGNDHTAREWSELGFGGDSGAEGVATWAAVNAAVKACVESFARQSSGNLEVQYILVRTEDFATEDLALRRATVLRVLQALNVPSDTADVDRGSAVFDSPIDAPADFLQTHYGRWRALPYEEQKRRFDAAKPGLDAMVGLYKLKRNIS